MGFNTDSSQPCKRWHLLLRKVAQFCTLPLSHVALVLLLLFLSIASAKLKLLLYLYNILIKICI